MARLGETQNFFLRQEALQNNHLDYYDEEMYKQGESGESSGNSGGRGELFVGKCFF